MALNFEIELKSRVEFIKGIMTSAKADGIVFGNSGGKDSALVGILCKMACDNTVGVIMPCCSDRNYGEDKSDAESVSGKFNIESRLVDLTSTRETILQEITKVTTPNDMAVKNIAPRLRMTTLYAIAAAENRLVAGTGNSCETFVGYFTKWGDGACDFNPISDLSVSEIYQFLEYLGAPLEVITKAPSAGLFDGQTDESELGVTYKEIEQFIKGETIDENSARIIERYNKNSEHKRQNPPKYKI